MYNIPKNNKGKKKQNFFFKNELGFCLSSSTMVSSLIKLNHFYDETLERMVQLHPQSIWILVYSSS